MKLAAKGALVGVVLASACGSSYGSARPPEADNVVLIVVDALRPDHLGAYGYRAGASPNIDRLAREGVLFRQAIAQANWTLPSVASIMTSLYPSAHGARRLPRDEDWARKMGQGRLTVGPGERLEPSVPTLAELLAGRGFATAGVAANGFVGPVFGLARGFQEYDVRTQDLRSLEDSVILPWLARSGGRRFFLYVHAMDVHEPYGTLVGTRQALRTGRQIREGRIDGSTETLHEINVGRIRPTRADLARIESLYDDGLRFADAQIGRLVEELSKRGLLERTMIIVTADHGEAFFEHGLMRHANAAYDEQLKVPLILRLPGGPRGAVVDRQVRSIDIMPTVLEALGVPAPPQIQGASLLDILQGGAPSDRTAFSEPQVYLPSIDNVGTAAVLRTPDWKLVELPDGRVQLFHLAADPGEGKDVGAAEPAMAARLKARLAAWRAECGKLRARFLRPAPAAALDDETKAELRAAGYVR